MKLEGAVAILTGASRGIGGVLAEHLAGEGVDLVLAARSKEDLDHTVERVRGLGARAIAVPTNVTDGAQLQALVDAAALEFGRIDLLVNNAGIECAGYSESLELDQIESTIQTNLIALIQLTRLVIPQMIERGRGHVCNIASVAGKVARPYSTVYAASKHGVVGFSWSLRAELASRGVEVSVVCPGYVSEVGMFADRSGRLDVPLPPRGLDAVSPVRVARETIAAIEKNRPETIVGPFMMKIADIAFAISPQLGMNAARRTGAYDYIKREATGDRS